jgi:hypothetical protein
MPVLPKIDAIIPAANFELIRDQIGAVLLLEIGNQKVLDPTFQQPNKIWVERFVPFNANEFPAINVRFQNGPYDERSREEKQVHAIYTYFIDISFIAKSKNGEPGDQLATVALHKMMRVVRAILANPNYDTLGFARPFNKRAWVNSIEVFEPMEFADSTNQINGRVEYCIEVPEYVAVPAGTNLLNEITTQVKLNNSEKGYFWDYKQLPIVIAESGTGLTDVFFESMICEIQIGDTVYRAGTDFTQAGTTITATTFAFTEGTTIIAKTL